MMTAVRVGALCLGALTLQITLFTQVRLFGVAPELLALVAILAGMIAGSQRGSLIAFVSGLTWDVYLATPLGLSAISFTLVAYAVSSVDQGLIRDTRAQMLAIVFGGTAASIGLYAIMGELMGQGDLVSWHLVRVMLVASAMNALLSIPVAPVMRWAVA